MSQPPPPPPAPSQVPLNASALAMATAMPAALMVGGQAPSHSSSIDSAPQPSVPLVGPMASASSSSSSSGAWREDATGTGSSNAAAATSTAAPLPAGPTHLCLATQATAAPPSTVTHNSSNIDTSRSPSLAPQALPPDAVAAATWQLVQQALLSGAGLSAVIGGGNLPTSASSSSSNPGPAAQFLQSALSSALVAATTGAQSSTTAQANAAAASLNPLAAALLSGMLPAPYPPASENRSTATPLPLAPAPPIVPAPMMPPSSSSEAARRLVAAPSPAPPPPPQSASAPTLQPPMASHPGALLPSSNATVATAATATVSLGTDTTVSAPPLMPSTALPLPLAPSSSDSGAALPSGAYPPPPPAALHLHDPHQPNDAHHHRHHRRRHVQPSDGGTGGVPDSDEHAHSAGQKRRASHLNTQDDAMAEPLSTSSSKTVRIAASSDSIQSGHPLVSGTDSAASVATAAFANAVEPSLSSESRGGGNAGAAAASAASCLFDVPPPQPKTEAELARMTPSERRRYDRNWREQQRSYRISQQIKELRDVLADSNVPYKPNKFSILISVTEYIKQLQSRAIMLDAEHHKLVSTIGQAGAALTAAPDGGGMGGGGTGTATPPSSSSDDSEREGGSAAPAGGYPHRDPDLLLVQGIDYKGIFGSCPYAIGVASLDGRVLACNEALEALFGCEPREMVEQSLFLFIRNHQEIFEAMADLLKRSSLAAETGELVPPVDPPGHLLFWCGTILSQTAHKLHFTITLTTTPDSNPKYFSFSAALAS